MQIFSYITLLSLVLVVGIVLMGLITFMYLEGKLSGHNAFMWSILGGVIIISAMFGLAILL
jgi:hypothetical protein